MCYEPVKLESLFMKMWHN